MEHWPQRAGLYGWMVSAKFSPDYGIFGLTSCNYSLSAQGVRSKPVAFYLEACVYAKFFSLNSHKSEMQQLPQRGFLAIQV